MNRNLCQRPADSKAFKGKGEAWKLLQGLMDDLRAIWREMEILAHDSGTGAGAAMQTGAYIQVHRITGLPKTGAVKELRWRLRQHSRDSHVLWPQVEALLTSQSISVRRYYWHLNQRMLDMNCQAGILRSTAMRLLARMHDRTNSDGDPHMFVAWVKGELSLADFDMRSFHTEDATK